jgi:hypothetical protein
MELRLEGLKEVRLAAGERSQIPFRVNGVPGRAAFKVELSEPPG